MWGREFSNYTYFSCPIIFVCFSFSITSSIGGGFCCLWNIRQENIYKSIRQVEKSINSTSCTSLVKSFENRAKNNWGSLLGSEYWYEKVGDVLCLSYGYKSRILVSHGVFMTKQHYFQFSKYLLGCTQRNSNKNTLISIFRLIFLPSPVY